MDWYLILAWAVLALAFLSFILLAYRDLKQLGTLVGLGRVVAMARLVVIESFSARVWALIPLWLVICVTFSLAVRPYDETERMALYLQILLRSQEMLVLIMLVVLACLSLPRERERRTILTTGSKPVTRLEILLGKIAGFGATSALILGLMGILSYGVVFLADWQIRRQATELYERQKIDFDNVTRKEPASESLRRLGQDGTLVAQSYLTAQRGMQVAGMIQYRTDGPPERYLKGGSSERVIYQFPSLPASLQQAQRPFLFINFPALWPDDLPVNQRPALELNLVMRLMGNPRVSQEKTLQVNPQTGIIQWAPDPDLFFDMGLGSSPGPVEIEISCPTKLAYLKILESKNPNESNILVVGLDRSRLPGGSQVLAPGGSPRMLGFEKRDYQQIMGPDPKAPQLPSEVASWRFSGLRPRDVIVTPAGKFRLDMVFKIEKQENQNQPSLAVIEAYSLDHPGNVFKDSVLVEENRLTLMELPLTLLDGSDLVVNISSGIPGHWLGALNSSVRVSQPSGWFICNLAKSELVIWCESLLLCTLAVGASVRLSWPVALLTSLTGFVLGNVFEFVRQLEQAGGFSLIGYMQAQKLKGVWWYELGSLCSNTIVKTLYILVNLLPDFTKFDAGGYILQARNMPTMVLLIQLGWAALYLLPLLAVGYLLIRRQELA